jgi:hypothetical protein
MPYSSSLPTPAEWPGGSGRRYVAALVFVLVLALACVPIGFGFVAIGHPGGLKYAALFAALLLLTGSYTYVTRVRPLHRETDVAIGRHDGAPATELRYSRAAFVIVVGVMTCVTAIFAFASVDYFLAGDEVTAPQLAGTLFGMAALFCASFLVSVATGRLRRGRVVLSQRGIHQRGRAFSSFLPWEAIAGAKAAYDGLTPQILVIGYTNAPWEKRQYSRLWRLDKLPPVPMIAIDCTAFALDHNLIYHLVKFYVGNPATRHELGTDAGLHRARTGAFV